MRERVLFFVGSDVKYVENRVISKGIHLNSAFDIEGYISDDKKIIGIKLSNGCVVKDIQETGDLEYNSIIIIANIDGEYYRKVKEYMISENLAQASNIYGDSAIFYLPYNANLGGITIEDSYFFGKYVDIKWMASNGYLQYGNDLEKFFFSEQHRYIHKLLHYFDIYDIYFKKFRGKDVRIMEIGVQGGGSMEMWKYYFGEHVEIIGIDILPECKKYERDNIRIEIGSQEDVGFLDYLVEKYNDFDIIIDDGGHTANQQNVSFEKLFPYVKDGGIYLCEDCHTSYFEDFDGGYRKNNTFIEQSKKRIDDINYNYINRYDYIPEVIVGMIKGIHFYDSIIVYEKKNCGKAISCRNALMGEEIIYTSVDSLA